MYTGKFRIPTNRFCFKCHHRIFHSDVKGYPYMCPHWKYFCDLVYSSDNSSFDMTSGHEINSPQNMINSVMQLCREYE